MKRFSTILMACSLAGVVFAQSEEQSGVAAKMELANGKSVPVYLQRLQDGKLVFQIYKRPQNIPLNDLSKISRFDFLGKLDITGCKQLYNSGDYQALIDKMSAELKPSLDEYWQYMEVENNLQEVFSMLLDAYRGVGDKASAEKSARILVKSGDAAIRSLAQSVLMQVVLDDGRIEDAEKMMDSIESEAGKLFLQACVARAQQKYAEAFKFVDDIIAEHGNDLAWMPQAELLDAKLYLDVGLTNSAINTARQVKNIYGTSSTAVEAQAFKTEVEAKKAKDMAAAKARQEAEEKERAEVRARAEARAGVVSEPAEGSATDDAGAAGNETNAVQNAESDVGSGG